MMTVQVPQQFPIISALQIWQRQFHILNQLILNKNDRYKSQQEVNIILSQYNQSDMEKTFNQCLNVEYLTQQCDEDLTCIICLQFMANPYYANCGHVFGIDCIQQWKQKTCPMCRKDITQLKIHDGLKQKATTFEARCNKCDVELPAFLMMEHLQMCPKNYVKWINQMRDIVQQQKQIMDIEINPHINEAHGETYETEWEIFDNHGQKYLWNNNPWWNNQDCQQCKDLWHLYKHHINPLQKQRQSIITNHKLHMNML